MFEIKIIYSFVTLGELKELAERQFGTLVKAVVDVEKRVMAIGGELHADEEAVLLEKGSKQENLWGINLYPEQTGDDFIEFDSMINIRPHAGNRSRSVENPELQKRITAIVNHLVKL